MKLILKVLGGVALLVVAAVVGVLLVGSRNLSRSYDVPPHAISLDGADAAEGQRLATTYACTLCHGGDLAGSDFLQGMPMADLPASNLTGRRFSVPEIERAVRHGLGADGRPLMIMPARAYSGMSDEDLADLAAYIHSIPEVSTRLIERRVGPIGRLAAAMSPAELVTGSAVDHEAEHPVATPLGDGRYQTSLCRFCHGEDLGGRMFTADAPMWAPNLTPHPTGIGGWTLDRFKAALQEGRKGDGSELDPDHMPWPAFSAFTDAELQTVWDHLNSLTPIDRSPPVE
ncbi:MAG: cytochrome c [Gemmatimonadota bacterium]|nr:cytochrome c [Gemmatimonadota bacterium]